MSNAFSTAAPTDTSGELVNKVQQSGLRTLNLEDYRPKGERVLLDIADQLFQGLILREKDFRAWVKDHDWGQYTGKYVAITCSADAIVPAWAFMLLVTRLQPVATFVHYGTLDELEETLLRDALHRLDWAQFAGEKIVLKGCGGISTGLYTEATRLLMPYAAKLMYGEPCSMVPLFKDLSRVKA